MTEEDKIGELKKEAELVKHGLEIIDEKRNIYKSRLVFLERELRKYGDTCGLEG